MDRFWWNWWPNWRFFDALTDPWKFFYQFDLLEIRETIKAGAKKWDFIAILAILVEKLGYFWSEIQLKIHEKSELLPKS